MVCSVRTAAFSSRFFWILIVVQCVVWDFGRHAGAASGPGRPGSSPDPAARPAASPGDSLKTALPPRDDDTGTTGSNKCRRCPSGHYRQSSVRSGIRARRKCGGVCQHCSVCPRGWIVRANCTATNDTVCTPCEDGQYWDPVRSRCRLINPLIHEVVVEDSGAPSPSPLTSEHAGPTPPIRRNPVARPPPGGSNPNKVNQPAPSLTEEAKSERWSTGYIVSLFVSATSGITVLILIVVVAIYVWLRCKQWKYERSLTRRGRCVVWTSCFENTCLCKQGSHDVVIDSDYSTMNTPRGTEWPTSSEHGKVTISDSKCSTVRESKWQQNHAPSRSVRNDLVVMETVTEFKDDEARPLRAASAGEDYQPDGSFMNENSSESREKRNATKIPLGNSDDHPPFDPSDDETQGETTSAPQEMERKFLGTEHAGNLATDYLKTAPSCLPIPFLSCTTGTLSLTVDADVHVIADDNSVKIM